MFIYTGKPDKPGKPVISQIRSTQVTVSWTPPDFDGGSPILKYRVKYKEVSTTDSLWNEIQTEGARDTTLEITGLLENTQYQFKVSAVNRVGESRPSSLSEGFRTYGRFILISSNFEIIIIIIIIIIRNFKAQ